MPARLLHLLRAVEERRKELHGGAIIAVSEGLVPRPDLDADFQRVRIAEHLQAMPAWLRNRRKRADAALQAVGVPH